MKGRIKKSDAARTALAVLMFSATALYTAQTSWLYILLTSAAGITAAVFICRDMKI